MYIFSRIWKSIICDKIRRKNKKKNELKKRSEYEYQELLKKVTEKDDDLKLREAKIKVQKAKLNRFINKSFN